MLVIRMQIALVVNMRCVYKAMAHPSCELLWLRSLLQEMYIVISSPFTMYCDNQKANHTTSNPVFHECTKHIEEVCHFI